MPEGKSWGGRREPGPGKRLGRPPVNEEPTRRVTVWLTETQIAHLRELGGGSVSAGVRALIRRDRQ